MGGGVMRGAGAEVSLARSVRGFSRIAGSSEEKYVRQFCVFVRYVAAAFVVLVFSASLAKAQTQLSSELRQKIDKLVLEVLEKTGTPSASLAVVKYGQNVYVQAYGHARPGPPTPAKGEK